MRSTSECMYKLIKFLALPPLHLFALKMNWPFIFVYIALILAPAVYLGYKIPKVGVFVALIYIYVMSKALVESYEE